MAVRDARDQRTRSTVALQGAVYEESEIRRSNGALVHGVDDAVSAWGDQGVGVEDAAEVRAVEGGRACILCDEVKG